MTHSAHKLSILGPSHKLSANGYYTRDGRREVHPPTLLADGTMALASGEASVEVTRWGEQVEWGRALP